MTMPQHREEPRIYSGKILMLDGSQMGELVPTPYIVAQGLVASGQARWEGDETPLPRHTAAVIAERRRKREEETAADDAHFAAKQAAEAGESLTPKTMQPGDVAGARPLYIAEYPDSHVVILRPFPQRVEMSRELVENDDDNVVIKRVEDRVQMTFANASALYQIVAENEEFVYAELLESTMPEVEIPNDWRERNHLVNIGAAKKLMALDSKMNKADAVAVIEEWTKVDDTIPAEKQSAEQRNENGRILDGNHEGPKTEDKDGKPIEGEAKTPAQIAEEAERKFAEDEGSD